MTALLRTNVKANASCSAVRKIADLQAVFRPLSNHLSATSSLSDSTLQNFVNLIQGHNAATSF